MKTITILTALVAAMLARPGHTRTTTITLPTVTLKATAIQARASLPVRGESDPCKDDPNPHCDRSQIVHDRNEDERSRCWNCKYICENHAELCYQTECYKHMDDECEHY